MEHNKKILSDIEDILLQVSEQLAQRKANGNISAIELAWLKDKLTSAFDLTLIINKVETIVENPIDIDNAAELKEIPVVKKNIKTKTEKKVEVDSEGIKKKEDIFSISEDLKDIIKNEVHEHSITKLSEIDTNDALNIIDKADKKILAEKFSTSGKSIYESMGEKAQPQKGIYEQIQANTVKSLNQGIGINDKFLFVKELFKGDIDAFQKTINNLDQAASLDEIYNYLNSNFDWNPESEHVQRLLGIAKRKFTDDKK